MATHRLLVVDDEPAVRRFLSTSLTAHGYDVIAADSGSAGIAAASAQRPALIILDLGLPDLSGTDVTRVLREWTQVPIIILSVQNAEAEKVAALDAGADDYLTKPFGMAELLARIRTALRHAAQREAGPVFTTNGLRVDLEKRLVTVNDEPVSLTPNEYDLLKALCAQAGRVLTHHQLLRAVWGPGYDQEQHLLRVNISNLRRKIEPDPTRPRFVVTEPGVGYRLRVE